MISWSEWKLICLSKRIPLKLHCFFNLTSVDLSKFVPLFNLGLKHIPIPRDISNQEIDAAFKRFKNSTKWQYYHRNSTLDPLEEEDDDNPYHFVPKLKPRNKETPDCNLVSESTPICQILNDLETNLEEYKQMYPVRHRFSKQFQQVKDLQQKFPEILIRPVDKNLGMCALHLRQYDEMVMEHLSKTTNYSLVCYDVVSAKNLLSRLTATYEDFVSNSSWYSAEQPLISFEYDFQFPKFHCLPKLHKQGKVKGRPIAGQVNWITTPISIVLDHRLQKDLFKFPNILKNSNQLVKELEMFNFGPDLMEEEIYFITGDVEALYPSMDLKRLSEIISRVNHECTPLVDFVCQNSFVSYAERIYHQINGIPMGTNAAVSLANIYVGDRIDRYIESRKQVLYYRRYIDDLFILWKGPLDLWRNAMSSINNLEKGLKIEFSKPSKNMAIFLDLQVYRDPFNKTIQTTVYQKPLNKYHYISPSSCHEPNMFSGFIKGELTRYARLSSTVFAYEQVKRKFRARLIARGYKRAFIDKIFKKHTWSTRFKDPPLKDRTILPFVIPYSLRHKQDLLKSALYHYRQDLEEQLPNPKILVCYSKRRSLSQMLCPSSLSVRQKQWLVSNGYHHSPLTASNEKRSITQSNDSPRDSDNTPQSGIRKKRKTINRKL